MIDSAYLIFDIQTMIERLDANTGLASDLSAWCIHA
jgi:hypothetical protein